MFDEKVEDAIGKCVRATVRMFKERRKMAQEAGTPIQPPSFEEFSRVVHSMMDSNMRNDLAHLRSPDMRDLLEKTWSQKLRSYTTQKSLRDSYESLVRRF
jgi:hypothetical protein